MLTVHLAVNREPIGHFDIVNKGPIAPSFSAELFGVVANDPEPDGWREYEWASSYGTRGKLFHKRSDGAVSLARKVLAAHAQRDVFTWTDEHRIVLTEPEPVFCEACGNEGHTAGTCPDAP